MVENTGIVFTLYTFMKCANVKKFCFTLNFLEGIFIYWNMYLHSLRIIMKPPVSRLSILLIRTILCHGGGMRSTKCRSSYHCYKYCDPPRALMCVVHSICICCFIVDVYLCVLQRENHRVSQQLGY